MRKNRENYQNFWEKSSLEFCKGWVQSNLVAYSLEYLSDNNIMLFWASHDSSLFQNRACQFVKFSDYVIGHDVIGHDIIGDLVSPTDNSGIGLFAVENR